MKLITGIQVNANWRIDIDANRNHTPWELRAADAKKSRGNDAVPEQPKWVLHKKFFCSIKDALKYIADEIVLNGGDCADIDAYINRINAVNDQLNTTMLKAIEQLEKQSGE